MPYRCALLCLCLLLSSCRKYPSSEVPIGTATEHPPVAGSSLPPPIQLLVNAYADECRQLSGTLTGPTSPIIQTLDLDMDGKPDFILNPKNLQCSQSVSLFCPNAGCNIRIAISSNDYHDYLLIPGGDPVIVDTHPGHAIVMEVQHFNCEGASRDRTCVNTIAWHQGKLTQTFSTKPSN